MLDVRNYRRHIVKNMSEIYRYRVYIDIIKIFVFFIKNYWLVKFLLLEIFAS